MRNALVARLTLGLLRLLSWLSLAQAQRLGSLMGWLAWRSRGRAYQVTQINIQHCFPQLSAQAQATLVRDSLRQTGKLSAEMGLVWHWPPQRWQPLIKSVLGEAVLQAAQQAGRGVIILAPHFGNWEMLNLYLGERYGMVALYEPPNIQQLDASIRNARMRAGSTLVPTTATGIRSLYKALQAGKVVGVLPDQVPDRRAGVHAPFFGLPALTMTLVQRLVKNAKPLVLLSSATRLPDAQGFALCFTPVLELDNAQDELSFATRMNQAVEALVLTDPSQYQWEYKRFRRRPAGTEDIYASASTPRPNA